VRSPPRSTQAKIFYGPGLCCRARPLAGVEFIGPTVVVLGAHHTHAFARAKSRETRWRRAGCSANPHLSDNRDAACATDHRARCQLERSTEEP
jgi:hypothetical protein